MLELRPHCECCGASLAPDAPGAWICSFECTFCEPCTSQTLKGKCPNCGGTLQQRPHRAAALLAKYPASTKRIVKDDGCQPSAA